MYIHTKHYSVHYPTSNFLKMIKKRYTLVEPTMSIVYAMLMIKGVTSFGRFHQRALYTSVDGNFIIRANENVSELNNNIDQVFLLFETGE